MTKLAQTTPERIKELKEFLKKTKKNRERDRTRALIKLIEGKKRSEVAGFFDIAKNTLDIWISNFKKYGVSGIKDKLQLGNFHLLTKNQKDEIKKILNSKRPKDLKLEGDFWSIPKLKKLVKYKFNLKYKSPESYRSLFKYCGFTFHKPAKVNKKQSSQMRKKFEVKLKKNSKDMQEKAVWYW